MLSAYFFLYGITQIIAGYCTQRVPPKSLITIALTLTTVLTVLSPVATKYSPWALVTTRMLMGISHGFVMPAIMVMITKWSVKQEINRGSEVVWTAEQTASLVTPPLGAYLSQKHYFQGWPDIFYVYGIISLPVLSLWLAFASNNPDEHRWVGTEELLTIKQTSVGSKKRNTFLGGVS